MRLIEDKDYVKVDHPKYKYKLLAAYVIMLPHNFRLVEVSTEWLTIRYDVNDGWVVWLAEGYHWDGATNCPDFDCIMRWALLHDALYQLLRAGMVFGHESFRKKADSSIHIVGREDGCVWLLRAIIYRAVQMFGAKHAAIKEVENAESS